MNNAEKWGKNEKIKKIKKIKRKDRIGIKNIYLVLPVCVKSNEQKQYGL